MALQNVGKQWLCVSDAYIPYGTSVCLSTVVVRNRSAAQLVCHAACAWCQYHVPPSPVGSRLHLQSVARLPTVHEPGEKKRRGAGWCWGAAWGKH